MQLRYRGVCADSGVENVQIIWRMSWMMREEIAVTKVQETEVILEEHRLEEDTIPG